MKFDIGDFNGNLLRFPNLVKIGQKIGHEDLSILIFSGDIKSPSKRCVRLKWYQDVTIKEKV